MNRINRLVCVVMLMALTCCRKQAAIVPSKQVTTLGSVEVTASLEEIRGEFPPNKLYDYAYVMKYRVLQVHRGNVEGQFVYVGHYNPLKPRSSVADRFVKDVGGKIDRFRVGDIHRMALDAPLVQCFMGGIIDKHIKEPGTRYWALWTEAGSP